MSRTISLTIPGPKPGRLKATNLELIRAYAELGSVDKVGKRFGMNGSSVHERLAKLGVTRPINVFGPSEQQRLQRDYETYAAAGRLGELAANMGRTKHFLCRQAKALGLTDPNRPKPYLADSASVAMKARITANGHSRGMLGRKHTPETRAAVGRASRASWERLTEQERAERTVAQMKAKVAIHGSLAGTNPRGSWKAGWREIGEVRKYFRSKWEANYARYLQWLKERGEIANWQHEPETFWFEAIRRGVRSYLPDFRVWATDGTSTLHEVKGWMDARSRTTLRRMAKYHPHETIIVISEREYRAIERTAGRLIGGWE